MITLINAVKDALQSCKLESLYRNALSLLAVAILVITTACSSPETTSKINSDSSSPNTVTELYKPITPEVGGMNGYSDVDPRVDTSKTDTKAERLIGKAKNSQGKDINPLEQIKEEFDRKGIQERVNDTADSVSRSAQETVEGISKGTRKGLANLKENTESFKDDIKSSARKGY
jgi:hypothetical protein